MKCICQTCGKEFNLKPSAVKKGKGKYCSLHCRRKLNPIRIEGDVAFISLTNKNGEVIAEAIIDATDVEKIKRLDRRWYATWHKTTNQYYAQVNIKKDGKWTRISLHRFILDAPDNMDVDHINHNMLDNRRQNLRLCLRNENLQNRKGAQRNNNTSGIRGVSWDKERQKWIAHITLNRRFKYIGRFDDIKDAENAVIKARQKYMPFSQENIDIKAIGGD